MGPAAARQTTVKTYTVVDTFRTMPPPATLGNQTAVVVRSICSADPAPRHPGGVDRID